MVASSLIGISKSGDQSKSWAVACSPVLICILPNSFPESCIPASGKGPAKPHHLWTFLLCDTSRPCLRCLLPCTPTIRSELLSTDTCPKQSQCFHGLGTSHELVTKPWPCHSGLTCHCFCSGIMWAVNFGWLTSSPPLLLLRAITKRGDQVVTRNVQ